jgi:hypothetical protein
MSRIPTYSVPGLYYLRAIGAALGVALPAGLIWAFIRRITFFGFFNFLVAAGIGYGIGEAISMATNRKRGAGLSVIAGMAVISAYVVSIMVPWGRSFFYFDIISVIIGMVVGVTRLR